MKKPEATEAYWQDKFNRGETTSAELAASADASCAIMKAPRTPLATVARLSNERTMEVRRA